MQRPDLANWAVKPIAVAALVAGLVMPLAARAETPTPNCNNPEELVRLAHPLARVARKISFHEPITIVAIGSSSTAGAGASSPANSYPSQLAADLQQRFPKQPIVVINRGVNGEEVNDMLKRFDQAVVAAKPDLVLWQLGTNSVIRDHVMTSRDSSIRDGLKIIRSLGADVVLIDPQFAPKVIVKPEAEHMVELLANTAKAEDVDLFRRYEVMKHWKVDDKLPFEAFVSPDGLHLNDFGYACMAKGLAQAIAEAAQRPVMSATAQSHHMLP
ncbi:MAG: SGNH/GDSL hydrolase family protein [Pseudolabrys sp.]